MPNKYRVGTTRFYIRVHESLKQRVFTAARLVGLPATEFARRAIEREVRQIEEQFSKEGKYGNTSIRD